MAAPVWRTRAAVAYLLAAIAGATVTAVLIGMVGGLARALHSGDARIAVPIFVGVVVAAWLQQAFPHVVRLPQNRRQVPQRVRRFTAVQGGAHFGFEMGLGFRTYVSAASPYILIAWLALYADPWPLLLVAAVGFGAGRSLPNFIALRYPDWPMDGAASVSRVSDVAATAVLAALVIVTMASSS